MSKAQIAAVVALGLMAGAHSADAAVKKKPTPKPLCQLVTDPSGDVKTSDASIDLLSADVASNKDTITVVFRVAKLTADDTLAPTGRFYSLSFTTPDGLGNSITAQLTPTGNIWNGGSPPSTSTGTGVVDVAKNEVRVSVPIDRLVGHPLFKPGTLLTNLVARADYGNPVLAAQTSLGLLGDVTTKENAKSYPIGAASCVAVGK